MDEYQTTKRSAGTTKRARELRDGDNIAEALLWNELKDRKLAGYKFIRQHPIGPYFADFACRQHRLVVEVDGSQHADSSHDAKRNEFMRSQGYSVIRFWNTDILKMREDVCGTIIAALERRFSGDIQTPEFQYFRGEYA